MNAEKILANSKPVPRYTSYPTAPHFHEGVTGETYRAWLSTLQPGTRIGLYVHVPYCDQLCWFCGCHTKHTLRYEPVASYLTQVEREIEMVAALLPAGVSVSNIHWGGGSPTMLTPDDTRRLATRLSAAFPYADDAELAVEIDPRDLTEEKLDALADAGIGRASIGVQDFSEIVQKAINRHQSFEVTRAAVDGLRRRGVGSLNCDLVYGLPHQTQERLLATVDSVIRLRPDRIALFGYAHVPWMKKHMQLIDEAVLPGAVERFDDALAAADRLVAAGYQRIGLDHFALPEDSLAIAARQRRLHRNFQGYTTDATACLIGLGPSAIGSFPQGYVQNIVAIGEWGRAVEERRLPIAKGVARSTEDTVRAFLIERLMCDFEVSSAELSARFGADAAAIQWELAQLSSGEVGELVEFDGDLLRVNEEDRPFVRRIAATFDTYLRDGKGRHSIAV
ncbi:oxygen-independent coproporphyrinogen III oxidase [Consotaella salsifontis]|uniref:Coproporphyrinogen-III oxidase n=1 Tax=Consotaella salsifontis TaxID=1365950 RepID=A0A1T4R8M1_9HYPH|nr:oxygen-independent coproporphyrinogen III oxidase [Consotaella salsifontis]SKA12018.1 coproporphyrinogen III oxidase, anaerobic [Consotaella salsifontis]